MTMSTIRRTAAYAVAAMLAAAVTGGVRHADAADAVPSAPIYDGALRAPWANWSWATTNFGGGVRTPAGVASIAASFGAWQAVYFRASAGYALPANGTLELDVRGGTAASPALLVRSLLANGQWTSGTMLAASCTGGVIPAGAWTHCRIPLAQVAPQGASVLGLTIQEWRGVNVPTMSFANVTLLGAASTPAPVAVTISPTSATVVAGATRQFTASVTGSTNTAVTWSIQEGAAGGAVSAAGLYTAPAAAGTYHVVSRSQADTSKTASATVTVTAAPVAVAITISPTSATLVAGATRQFTASVTGSTNTAVTWTIQEGAAGGAVSAAGLYTAPAAAGTYHVVSRSQADTSKTATATVTVTAAPVAVAITISPTATTLAVSGTQQFTATVTGTTNTAVQWLVQQGSAGGAIDATGRYTAPSTTGAFQVVARSQADTTKTATAAVTVSAGGTYVLAPDRATAWKPGVTYNGGIPNRTTVCASLSAATYGNGSADASAAIQAALNACPVGQVVLLSAGTFTTNTHLLVTKGITLRGAGAGQTILQKTNGAVMNVDGSADYQPIVVIGQERWMHPLENTATALTADVAKGATSVTVANGSGFAAGQFVLLDEQTGASWRTDPLGRGQVWAAPDWRTTWMFHNPAYAPDDPLVASTPTGGNAASWFSRQDRVTSEMKEIASVSGNTITFTSPAHIGYRASRVAQLTRFAGHVVNAGLEGFTAKGGSDSALRFEAAAYSWVKNVEVTVWRGEGVGINNSFRCELRDSYIHDASYSVPGGGAYAISLANGSAEILIENNISMLANKVMVARCAGAGSVVGYNYFDSGFIRYAEDFLEIGMNASHMVGPHHVLFEGNYAFNFDSDKTHGSSAYMTIFRNWLRGVRRPFVNPQTGNTIDDANSAASKPKRCAGAQAYSNWFSFVGNVLGASGKMTGWQYEVTGPGQVFNGAYIWALGWDDASPQPYDTGVAPTTVRDGNWDWLQSKQSWHNSAPATLPASMYMPGKPAFFGANTWPWVDPSTGATLVLPAKARFDAGNPNG